MDATVANIVEKGLGYYALRLAASETDVAGAVYVVLNVAGASAYSYKETIVGALASDGVTLASATLSSIASSVWAYAVEGAYTATHYMRLIASSTVWKVSGFLTSAPLFRDAADTKNRITATTSSDGRTAVSVDPS